MDALDAHSTWEVTQKFDPQQDKIFFFFFAGLQVIYFLNLGIENMNSLRHGLAPI